MTDSLFNIGDDIKKMSCDEIIDYIGDLYEKWILDSRKNSIFNNLDIVLENFGINAEGLQLGAFENAKFILIQKMSYLRIQIDHIQFDETDNEKEEIIIKFNKIFNAIVQADLALRHSLCLQNAMTETYIGSGDQLDMHRFTPIDTSNNNAKQNVILFCLEMLKSKEYRRYNGFCYQKILTKDTEGQRYDTHAWKQVSNLSDFIYSSIPKEVYYEMWQNLTSEKGMVSYVVDYLENHRGYDFEDIRKDRHVFAFNNGIYFTKVYSTEINPETNGGAYSEGNVDLFVPYTGPESQKIGSNVVASKYFDQDFDTTTIPNGDPNYRYNDYYNILLDKCPNLLSIMKYQDWDEEVQRWLLICLGRLCYNVGELDGWQIMPFLLGQAGTGKSTIITKIAKLFYEEIDIGTLSNNMEKGFGLGALKDKLLAIGPEIKGNFSMEQSEFQSIISGEEVQIATKHKTASSVEWKVPIIVAGNEVPQYSDNAGSISRRLLVFLFNKKVAANKSDTQLAHKLKKEISTILPLCIRAYLDAVNRYGESDIWNVVPKYFRDSRDEMAETTNALVHFLNSDRVVYNDDKDDVDPNKYVKESVFIDVFNSHCKEMNIGKTKWGRQYYIGPFQSRGLTTEKDRKKYPRTEDGAMSTSNYIIGVDINYNRVGDRDKEPVIGQRPVQNPV